MFARRILKYQSGHRDLFFYPLRGLLEIVSFFCIFTGYLRRFLYLKSILKQRRLEAKVISVGNIVAGGTGKTPLVIHLAEGLIKRGHKVAVLTRGYHRLSRRQMIFRGEDWDTSWQWVGDEPSLLSKRLPQLVIGVSKNRHRCGREISSRFDPAVFILDDGFQHRQLHRDLDIVVLEADSPFGARLQLKRDGKSSLRLADIIVLNRAGGGETAGPKAPELQGSNPDAVVALSAYNPSGIRDLRDDTPISVEEARELSFLAFSGIANPWSFGTTLAEMGLNIREHVAFPDHHRFKVKEHQRLVSEAKKLGAQALITTEKDAIRLSDFDKSEMPTYYVTIEVRFLQGEEQFWEAIEKSLKDAA